MKLYQSIGPNPAVVRLFIAEKGLDVPRQEVDLMGGENRRDDFLAVNPAGQLPALELDSGVVLSEITAICEYLEELHPEPALIGTTPEERAETRMWTRNIDLGFVEQMVAGFRYAEGLKLFESRMRCLPEAADGLKARAVDHLRWLDAQLDARSDAGPWICGDRYTLADILLYSFLAFGETVGQPLPDDVPRVREWMERMRERPAVANPD